MDSLREPLEASSSREFCRSLCLRREGIGITRYGQLVKLEMNGYIWSMLRWLVSYASPCRESDRLDFESMVPHRTSTDAEEGITGLSVTVTVVVQQNRTKLRQIGK